jgi:DNA-directed RNA polymerase subunit RPC12/RpoP
MGPSEGLICSLFPLWTLCGFFPLMLFCACIGSVIGGEKNRRWDGICWGFFFGPLGIIVIALLPVYYDRNCPECCLGIPDEAKRCGHCGIELPSGLDIAMGKKQPAMIQFSCPQCHKPFTIHRQHAGTAYSCNRCGQKMRTPSH